MRSGMARAKASGTKSGKAIGRPAVSDDINERIRALVLDGAGWHSSPRLNVPDNIVLLPLPPYAPELNPMENVWEYMRGNDLSHRVWDGYEAIITACCGGWNKLMQMPDRIASLTRREWAKAVVG